VSGEVSSEPFIFVVIGVALVAPAISGAGRVAMLPVAHKRNRARLAA